MMLPFPRRGFTVAATVSVALSLISPSAGADEEPTGPETSGKTASTAPVLQSVGFANRRAVVGVSPTKRSSLGLRAVVRRAPADARVLVRVAQYDVPGGQPSRTPVVKARTVSLKAVRTSGVGDGRVPATTFRGSVPARVLDRVAAQVPVGQAALLCIANATATSGGKRLAESVRAKSRQRGRACVSVQHQPRNRKAVNALLTGVLSDVALTRAGKRFTLTYRADNLSFFLDRPQRSARAIRFVDLSDTLQWRRTFGRGAPVVEVVVEGRTEPVTMRLWRPARSGAGRFRSRVAFPGSRGPQVRQWRGADLAIFADPRQAESRSPSCPAPRAAEPPPVPQGADFVAGLPRASLIAKPGRAHMRLEAPSPAFFGWFLSRNAGCSERHFGSADFAEMADLNRWRALFGEINPNSALLWRQDGVTRVLEFEQSRPRLNRRTGRWVSTIRPLTNSAVASKAGVRRFIEQYGRRLDVTAPYMFVDSTNTATNGGHTWQVDDNFSVRYQVVAQTLQLTFELRNNNAGWMGLSFHQFMFPADSIVAWWDEEADVGRCLDLYNPGIPTLPSFPSPLQDTNPLLRIPDGSDYDNRDNVRMVRSSRVDGTVQVTCERDLVTEDIFDFQMYLDQSFAVVAAYNDRTGWQAAYNANQVEHTAYGADSWFLQ